MLPTQHFASVKIPYKTCELTRQRQYLKTIGKADVGALANNQIGSRADASRSHKSVTMQELMLLLPVTRQFC